MNGDCNEGDHDERSTFVLHFVIHIHDFCNLGGGEGRDCLRGDCQPNKELTSIRQDPSFAGEKLAGNKKRVI